MFCTFITSFYTGCGIKQFYSKTVVSTLTHTFTCHLSGSASDAAEATENSIQATCIFSLPLLSVRLFEHRDWSFSCRIWRCLRNVLFGNVFLLRYSGWMWGDAVNNDKRLVLRQNLAASSWLVVASWLIHWDSSVGIMIAASCCLKFIIYWHSCRHTEWMYVSLKPLLPQLINSRACPQSF